LLNKQGNKPKPVSGQDPEPVHSDEPISVTVISISSNFGFQSGCFVRVLQREKRITKV
jgi:hypothetical protein